MDLDELAGHWTPLDDERDLVAGKRGPARLGFALIGVPVRVTRGKRARPGALGSRVPMTAS